MKKVLLSFLFVATSVFSQVQQSDLTAQLNLKKSNYHLKKLYQKIKFNYGMTYLGPSLSSNYEDGATYNRFNSGQDWQGVDTDPTGSYQVFHSFSLGFMITDNLKISYSYTFQDDVNGNIEYETYNKDGSVYSINQREKGLSYNNQRLNINAYNIYSNNYLFVSSGFYYEFPTTEGSINSDMEYGAGLSPTVGIYSSVPGLFHGFSFQIERDYYKRQDYEYNCGGFTCSQRYQTLRTQITAYLGYYTSDKMSWKLALRYDWDQMGDEAEHIGFDLANFSFDDDTKFNNNMDNVLEIGPSYFWTKSLITSAKLQMSVNKPHIDKTAVLASLSLSI